jgi:hypothetical protein
MSEQLKFFFLSSNRFDMFSVDETTRRKNAFFGGLHPNVRNVFFTHGDMDPLRSLGVTEDLNEYSPAVIIPRK